MEQAVVLLKDRIAQLMEEVNVFPRQHVRMLTHEMLHCISETNAGNYY